MSLLEITVVKGTDASMPYISLDLFHLQAKKNLTGILNM
jgi:hypothetical protein